MTSQQIFELKFNNLDKWRGGGIEILYYLGVLTLACLLHGLYTN
jgi:hypothetical protein